MCMACNNRLCAECGRRYGEHRVSDDACPGASPGLFLATIFKVRRALRRLERAGGGAK